MKNKKILLNAMLLGIQKKNNKKNGNLWIVVSETSVSFNMPYLDLQIN